MDSHEIARTTSRGRLLMVQQLRAGWNPPAHHAILVDEIARDRIDGRIEHYPEALHGFTFPTRYCYHKPSAERSWERTCALLRRQHDK